MTLCITGDIKLRAEIIEPVVNFSWSALRLECSDLTVAVE